MDLTKQQIKVINLLQTMVLTERNYSKLGEDVPMEKVKKTLEKLERASLEDLTNVAKFIGLNTHTVNEEPIFTTKSKVIDMLCRYAHLSMNK